METLVLASCRPCRCRCRSGRGSLYARSSGFGSRQAGKQNRDRTGSASGGRSGPADPDRQLTMRSLLAVAALAVALAGSLAAQGGAAKENIIRQKEARQKLRQQKA